MEREKNAETQLAQAKYNTAKATAETARNQKKADAEAAKARKKSDAHEAKELKSTMSEIESVYKRINESRANMATGL